MTNTYLDPQELLEILDKIRTFSTVKEVVDFINEIYPGWIITVLNRYSTDYRQIERNWITIAEKNNNRTAQIIIVDEIIFDDKHILVRTFAELLTRAGFSVRQKNEWFPCSVCNSALPEKWIYDKLKENNVSIPENWDRKCSSC